MEDMRKTQDNPLILHIVYHIAIIVFSIIAFASFAQDEDKEEEKEIDLPPVKIEVIDATQLDITKEKVRAFAKPGSELYAPARQKERFWYLTPTSVPEKMKEKAVMAKDDFLFSLSAYAGLPAALKYQMLLVKGFGKSRALLDLGRATLQSERNAKLVTDTSKEQGKSTIDRFMGSFAYQGENSVLKMESGYNARELGYLDTDGNSYINDRTLIGLSLDWNQKMANDVQSLVNINASGLRIEGPLDTDSKNLLDVETSLDFKAFLPRTNPIDTGLKVKYSVSSGNESDYRQAIIKAYLRDNYIRILPFVLGAGLELAVDTYENTNDDSWNFEFYPNPYVLLTSQLGSKTILQFGLERYILKHDLESLYFNKDYVRFNPNLNTEKAWSLHAGIQYRIMRKFSANVKVFGKEISDLTVFERTRDKVISWAPRSRSVARIAGVESRFEFLLLDEKLQPVFEYVHELHDQDEYIPYRPQDKGALTFTYFAPYGLKLSMSGEFYGQRYTDANGETLSGYFLWKPRISKTFSTNAEVSLSAELYSGEDDYQIWKGYGLPDRTVDFGLTIKF